MIEYSARLSESTVAILLFHGVIRRHSHAVRNYARKHIALDRFVDILHSLREYGGQAVAMSDIVAASRGRFSLPPRSFAVTFDDGFENNFSVAAPVLADFHIPAMFYVTTGFIGSNGRSWTDIVEEAVERSGRFTLRTAWCGVVTCATDIEKTAFLEGVRRYVKSNRGIDPYQFVQSIIDQLGTEPGELDPELDQKMSWHQVRALQGTNGFTVGGHSHTHRILEFLDDAELHNEINRSMSILCERLEKPVTHYSYPEGLAHCYSDRVIRMLRAAGIECSPTAEDGVNPVDTLDLFRLKRITAV